MSPDAPGRIAYAGRFGSAMYPELMYSSPNLENGVGILIDDIPENSHNSLPERSYDRTRSDPDVTISVRCSFSHTKGDVQFVPSLRSTLQTSAPVRASYAARNDCSSL